MISKSPQKSIIYWLLTGCALIYIMVLVGGLTRLTHSGLSITDWSFMGSIPPLNQQMWQERFEKYQQSPEFIKVNSSMTLQDFKPIFLWEYIHRMIGRLMMYVFTFGFIYFLIKKKITKSKYTDLTIVISGFRDAELQSKLESMGAKIGSTVSSKTDLVIVKELETEPTGKVLKAKELGIKIITKNQVF